MDIQLVRQLIIIKTINFILPTAKPQTMNNILRKLVPLTRPRNLTTTVKHGLALVGMEPKKVIDKTKASIRMMMELPESEPSIEYLRNSHQYGVGQAARLYSSSANKLALGDVASLLIDGELSQLELNSGHERFFSCARRALDTKADQQQSLKLHLLDNLDNLLKLATYLETISDLNYNRIILAILANYIENYQEITDLNLYKIAAHLTERTYLPKNLVQHFRELPFDDRKFEEIFQNGTREQIINNFQIMSYMLDSVLNLEKQPSLNNKQKGQSVINIKLKQKLVEVFFNFLSDHNNLDIALSLKPKLIFKSDLFQEHKSKYYKIIEHIFDPVIFSSVKMEQNLCPIIFDKLFIYSTYDEGENIVKILQRYEKCLATLEHISHSHRRGCGSLVMLCAKFSYFSKPLFYELTNNYLRPNIALKSNQLNFTHKKNRLYFITQQLLKLCQIATIIKLAANRKFSIEHLLLQDFEFKVSRLLDTSKYGNDNPAQALFLKIGQERSNIRSDKPLVVYQNFEEILMPEEKIKHLFSLANLIEKKLQITYNPERLQNISYPVNPRLNNGTRIKSLITIASLTKKSHKHASLFDQFYKLLESQQIVKTIESNLMYPGLVQAVYFIYFLAKEYRIQTANSPLDNFIKSHRPEIQKKIQKNLGMLKKMQDHQKIDLQFCNNIEFLSETLGVAPKKYGQEITQLYQKMFHTSDIVTHLRKYEMLMTKVTEYLSQMKGKMGGQKFYAFSNNIQFPFLADYLILYNNRKFVILLVDPVQKQRYENILKAIKNRKETQQSPIQVARNVQAKDEPVYLTPRELSLSYFSNSGTVILISGEEDIKNLRVITEKSK